MKGHQKGPFICGCPLAHAKTRSYRPLPRCHFKQCWTTSALATSMNSDPSQRLRTDKSKFRGSSWFCFRFPVNSESHCDRLESSNVYCNISLKAFDNSVAIRVLCSSVGFRSYMVVFLSRRPQYRLQNTKTHVIRHPKSYPLCWETLNPRPETPYLYIYIYPFIHFYVTPISL